MKYLYLITTILLGVLVISCEKTITINSNPYTPELSVECILKPNQIPRVYLGSTVDYFNPLVANEDLFVDNAFVTISSLNSIDTLKVTNSYNYYLCQNELYYEGHIAIQQGKDYQLQIDHDGQSYTAVTEMNVSPVEIDSVNFVSSFVDLFGEHEGVVVSFTDLPNEENYYRYQMDRVIDSSQEDIGNCAPAPFEATEIGRSIFSDINIDGAEMTVVIEPVYPHAMGDSASIFIQSLDPAAAQFYDDLDRQKNSKVNPFIEPVFIRSNIVNGFGIFGASNYSQPHLFVYPEEQ